MNTLTEPIENLFDLDLELVEEAPTAEKNRCLHTAYQSSCGGPLCIQQG